MLGLEELWRGPTVLDLEGGVITPKISHTPHTATEAQRGEALATAAQPDPGLSASPVLLPGAVMLPLGLLAGSLGTERRACVGVGMGTGQHHGIAPEN